MKRIQIILALLLTMTVQLAVASDNKDVRRYPSERMEKEARVYVNSLRLRGDSAERFTKIFLDYRQEIHKALENNRGKMNQAWKRGKHITDKEIDQSIKARFKLSRSLLDIREKYYGRFRQVLSPRMYEQFNMLEQRFDSRKVKEHERRRKEPSAVPAEFDRRGKTYKVSPPPH